MSHILDKDLANSILESCETDTIIYDDSGNGFTERLMALISTWFRRNYKSRLHSIILPINTEIHCEGILKEKLVEIVFADIEMGCACDFYFNTVKIKLDTNHGL